MQGVGDYRLALSRGEPTMLDLFDGALPENEVYNAVR